ncbi:MAG: septal ring lytic transglycosylase RlpA family protein [Acidobacteria bacterium]|nr:septal ring lytic transglycosylase RlpA family protein [Acidobacteriota bacterium]
MQRIFSTTARTCVTGVLALAGLGVVGASVRSFAKGTGTAPAPVHAPAPLKAPMQPAIAPVKLGPPEVGRASWYGDEFEGKTTANGEKFDPDSLTCAHRTLPLGSLIRVTNLRNKKTVTVRVNDRGPMLEDRILDLSHAAARKIGLLGLGKVKIQRIKPADKESERALMYETKNKPVDVSAVDNFEPFPFLQHR